MDTVPTGYLEDAFGRLVPERLVKPADLLRDQTVRTLVERVRATAASLAATKAALLADIASHCQIVADQYGAALSGAGNVGLVSYDGRMKVERVIADRIRVGEEGLAAEALIRAVLDEIQDPTARAIVDRTFRRHPKTGELSVHKCVDLMAVEIPDPRWTRAMAALRDALRVTGTAVYFRAYERERPDQPWRQIPLDFSSLVPAEPVAVEPAGGA